MSFVAPQNSDAKTCLHISIMVTLAEIACVFLNLPTLIAGIILIYFNIKEFDMDPLPVFFATGIFVLVQGASLAFVMGFLRSL